MWASDVRGICVWLGACARGVCSLWRLEVINSIVPPDQSQTHTLVYDAGCFVCRVWVTAYVAGDDCVDGCAMRAPAQVKRLSRKSTAGIHLALITHRPQHACWPCAHTVRIQTPFEPSFDL